MARILRAIIGAFVASAVSAGQSPPDVGHTIAADLQAGKYAEATELLTRALKQFPNNARLWTLNGLALVHAGKSSEALASFERALQLAPDYLPALEAAAQIEYEGDQARAVPLLQRILKIRPDDQTSHALLAAIAFKRGDCAIARTEFAAAQPASGDIGALKEFGSCLIGQRRIAEAIPAFQHISNLEPDNEAARIDLANVEFLAGNYSYVTAILSSVIAKDSSNANALDLLAEAYQANGDGERAMAASRQAIAAEPRITRYYVDFAYLCLAQHEFNKGIEMVNSGLQRVADPAPLYVARGILLSELAQYDKGEDDFLTAERLDPNVQLVSAAKGLTELQENNFPQAEKTVRERLREHPEDAFLHYLLAEVLAKQGASPGAPQFKEAVAAAAAAVRLNPNLAVAREVLGRLYLEDGKIDQAIEQSRSAYQLNPNDATALYHLIVALKKGNKTEQVPPLLHQLVVLKQRSAAQEDIERQYAAAPPH